MPAERPMKKMESGVCSSNWLSEALDHGSDMLILDCRGSLDFQESHVESAIHVAIPTLMLRRLKNGSLPVSSVISCSESKELFTSKFKIATVIVYDNETSDVSLNPSTLVSLLIRKLKEDGCYVLLLKGGFKAFQECCPHHCVRKREDDVAIWGLQNLCISAEPVEHVTTPESTGSFPVEVMPYLFLGNAENSADLECLYSNGIRYIVNVTTNVANSFEEVEGFHYLRIPIKDHWSQNVYQHFHQAIAFIEMGRSAKCGVLVHCEAGISRSVTVTMAYLMHHLHLSLNDAYDLVKRCKPNISPNFNFLGQLLDYEKIQVGGTLCQCSPDDCSCQSRTFFMSPLSDSSPLSS